MRKNRPASEAFKLRIATAKKLIALGLVTGEKGNRSSTVTYKVNIHHARTHTRMHAHSYIHHTIIGNSTSIKGRTDRNHTTCCCCYSCEAGQVGYLNPSVKEQSQRFIGFNLHTTETCSCTCMLKYNKCLCVQCMLQYVCMYMA